MTGNPLHDELAEAHRHFTIHLSIGWAQTRLMPQRQWQIGENLQRNFQQNGLRRYSARPTYSATSRFVTVCLDVLPAATAPGVSAPGVLGVMSSA
jgi:hypothetical protein